ncbi:MAG: hypothetical protein IJ091_00265 [Oscillospiraceae bacterium]|nr:hypothetical protein [Oscillospiraceae bacterium]
MAKETELIKRIIDLLNRADRTQTVTHSTFLTPAEQYELKQWSEQSGRTNFIFNGGYPDSERAILQVIPTWYESNTVPETPLTAIRIITGFGTPSHRDYLGSILGLGLKREWIGDIIIKDSTAYVICLRPSEETLLRELTHVNKFGVKCEQIALGDIPISQKSVKSITFTVQSPRLDAVVGPVFGLSRSHGVKLISAGAVSLNYSVCIEKDAFVTENDIISVRGYGKAKLLGETGKSKKGRTFLLAERYI